MKIHPSPNRVRQVTVVLVVLCAFVLGNFTGYMARPALARDATPDEFALFWEAWDLVEAYFVDKEEVDALDMTHGAIRGMLASLGDENHTVFFTPDEAEQQASSLEGSFEGIGAYVGIEEGNFTILSPIHGSPAEAAGLLAGDIVIAVDAEDIIGLPDWEVISRIRGPSGTTVVLTVVREDVVDPFDVTVTRDRIDLESVLWARVPDTNLGYLQITQFAADTGLELERALLALQELDGPPIAGVVLDLRNNPGGYLQEAIRVGSQFLEENEVILHARDAEGEVLTYSAYGKDGLARDLPMIVLVNEASASAAEIVAGALRSNERARLVGETTLGTGTVLRPFELSDGSVIRLGVTNWLTPDYDLIKNVGVQPDVVIEQAPTIEMMDGALLESIEATELYQHEDRQFASALLLLRLMVLEAENDSLTVTSGDGAP